MSDLLFCTNKTYGIPNTSLLQVLFVTCEDKMALFTIEKTDQNWRVLFSKQLTLFAEQKLVSNGKNSGVFVSE